MQKTVEADFMPAKGLENCHMQTLWGRLMRSVESFEVNFERMELPDGDFIDLAWSGETSKPIVLVLHGLGGSIESPYARGIAKAITDRHWRAAVMHFRGASGVPNRLNRCYHSGDTSDLQTVINILKEREPNTPIAVIGYSLGGNVLLKWLGECGQNSPIVASIAVSVPFDLRAAANKMQEGFSRFYQWYLLGCLKEMMLAKFHDRKAPISLDQIKQVKNFWEFDNLVTAPLHGFKNASDYYERSSCRPYLIDIKTPTLIIHAKDDPFMTPQVIPGALELSDSIRLELSEYGGHVGFISGSLPNKVEYWLDKRIIEFLNKIQFN